MANTRMHREDVMWVLFHYNAAKENDNAVNEPWFMSAFISL